MIHKLCIALVLFTSFAMAQPPAGPPARLSAKDAAPEDITGYWVSIVTEDWRWRMLTPAKGDITSIPLNPVGRKTAEAWDPAKDEAAGEQCKAYGAPGVMRLPTRLHITWQDDNTLKVTTTNLRPGYLRKNGIPYGAGGTLTEYFTRTNEANGDSWLLLTSIVEDPQYLASDFLTSDHYKREADGSKWNPTPCQAR